MCRHLVYVTTLLYSQSISIDGEESGNTQGGSIILMMNLTLVFYILPSVANTLSYLHTYTRKEIYNFTEWYEEVYCPFEENQKKDDQNSVYFKSKVHIEI